MRIEKEGLEDKVNSRPNTQGFGGVQALLGEFCFFTRRVLIDDGKYKGEY